MRLGRSVIFATMASATASAQPTRSISSINGRSTPDPSDPYNNLNPLLISGALAYLTTKAPAALQRLEGFLIRGHDFETYGLSQYERDVIICVQRAFEDLNVSKLLLSLFEMEKRFPSFVPLMTLQSNSSCLANHRKNVEQ